MKKVENFGIKGKKDSSVKDFFLFRTMVTVPLIQGAYLVATFLITAVGLLLIVIAFAVFQGASEFYKFFLWGFAILIPGNLIWRLICEKMVLFFKIHEDVRDIAESKTGKSRTKRKEGRTKSRPGLAALLVISLAFSCYLAIEKHSMEMKVKYVYRESNAYMSSEVDINGPYEISRTILNAFKNLPREDMVKSMEKAIDKLRASGNERGYYSALLKIGHEYEMLGWNKKAIDVYGKYLKKYPDSQGAYFDLKTAIESLSKKLEKGEKDTRTRSF